jgi:hypothetical protein
MNPRYSQDAEPIINNSHSSPVCEGIAGRFTTDAAEASFLPGINPAEIWSDNADEKWN